MGSASSNVPQEDDEDDFTNMEYIREGVVTCIPNEVKPRPKIGRNPKPGNKSNSRIKNESLRSALSIDLDNPEADKIRKEFEMFRLNKENELANFKRKGRKLEAENRKLKTELQALQKTCKKLRDERDLALDAEQRSLIRAAAIESDRDKVQRQFKIFRESKEGELQNLLKVKRNLETKIMKIDPSLLESEMTFQKDDDFGPNDLWTSVSAVSGSCQMQTNGISDFMAHNDGNGDHSYGSSSFKKADNGCQSHSNVVTFCWLPCQSHPADDSFESEMRMIIEGCSQFGDYLLNFFKISFDELGANDTEAVNLVASILNTTSNSYVSSAVFTNISWTSPLHKEMIKTVLSLPLPVCIFCTPFAHDDICDRDDCDHDNLEAETHEADVKCVQGMLDELKAKENNSLASFFVFPSNKELFHNVKEFVQKKLESKHQHHELKCLNFLGWEDVWCWQDFQQQIFFEHRSRFLSQPRHGKDLPSNKCFSFSWLEKCTNAINGQVFSAGPIAPLLVEGDDCSGKTTVTSRWISEYHEKTSPSFVLYYFVIDPDHPSSDPCIVLKCLMFQILQYFSTPFGFLLDQNQLVRDFPRWLEKVSALCPGGLVLVLDSIDRIKDFETIFNWLLDPLPIDLRVVVSLRGDSSPASWKSWPMLSLDPLTESETREYVDLLSRDSLNLDAEIILNHLLDNPLLCHPLPAHLVSAVSSLGSLDHAASCQTVGSLYVAYLDVMLEQFHAIFSTFREIFGLIICSRQGVTLSELAEMTLGRDVSGVKVVLEIVDLAVQGRILRNVCGVIMVENDQAKSAVKEWLSMDYNRNKGFISDVGNDLVTMSLKKLAGYHETRSHSARSILELSWIYFKLQEWDNLKAIVCDVERCLVFLKRNLSSELVEYWRLLRFDVTAFNSKLHQKLQEYEQNLENSESTQVLAAIHEEVGKFFANQGLNDEALEVLQRCIELNECNEAFGQLKIGQANNLLAHVHDKLGRRNAAEAFHMAALANFQSVAGQHRKKDETESGCEDDDDDGVGDNIVCGDEGREINDDDDHHHHNHHRRHRFQHLVVVQLELLANFHLKQGRVEMSDNLMKKANHLKSQMSSSPETMNKAHTIKPPDQELIMRKMEELTVQMSADLDDLSLAGVEHDLGVLHATLGHYRDAETLLKKSLEKRESVVASDGAPAIQSLNSLAALYGQSNQLDKVEELSKRLLNSLKMNTGQNRALLLGTLKNFIRMSRNIGRLDKAELYLEMFLDGTDQDSMSPENLASILVNLAVVCSQQGKHSKAEPLYQRALKIYRTTLPPTHPRILGTMRNLALSRYEQGDLEAAAQIYLFTFNNNQL